MALARKYQIIPGQAGFFHCYGRCVRRAFLCGHDPVTGRDFSHRRQWIVDRLELLCRAFAIDVFAYAVMSNHWHVVLYVEPERIASWSDEQVVERWRSVYRWRRTNEEAPTPTPEQIGQQRLGLWRQRLGSVSWFMKSLHEPLAHLANTEDSCTGHFWQGRFGCTVLLDDPAVLAAMAYVDLNPIRAELASSLMKSDYTSIQRRLRELALRANDPAETDTVNIPAKPGTVIEAAIGGAAKPGRGTSPMIMLPDYIALLETMAMTRAQRGETWIGTQARTALAVLGLNAVNWCRAVSEYELLYRHVAGSTDAISAFVKRIGYRYRSDVAGARLLSPTRKAA